MNLTKKTKKILTNILLSIAGGLMLTFILFVFNEFVVLHYDITGEWKELIIIKNTNYKAYKNLSIEFRIQLVQNGNNIEGSGEKIKEIDQQGFEYKYIPQKRVRIKISGCMEKTYFTKPKIHLKIIEYGKLRTTSSIYELNLESKNHLTGKFQSTAADSDGVVDLKKIY